MQARMMDIAAEAQVELLQRVCFENGSAVVTDSYRMLVEPLPFPTEGRRFLSAEWLAEDRHSLLSWDELYAASEESDESYPQWSRFLAEEKRWESAQVKWDGDGGYAHGRRRRDFEMAMVQWAHFNGVRRKPIGLVRLEISEGHLYYRLGMKVQDERAPFFVAFQENRTPMEATAEGMEDGVIGTYAAQFLSPMVYGMATIATEVEGDRTRKPLKFGYVDGGVGVLMPVVTGGGK